MTSQKKRDPSSLVDLMTTETIAMGNNDLGPYDTIWSLNVTMKDNISLLIHNFTNNASWVLANDTFWQHSSYNLTVSDLEHRDCSQSCSPTSTEIPNCTLAQGCLQSFVDFTKSIPTIDSNTSHNVSHMAQTTKHFEVTVVDIGMALLLITLIICVIIGNLLVISSVLLYREMRTLTNALIVSLATADLLVALMVLPISLYFEISDRIWFLGSIVCDFWITADVFCCTASILNIVVIALDRYWLITRNVRYTHNTRFPRKRICALMLFLAWSISAIISSSPLLGWREGSEKNDPYKCMISQDYSYTIFSTFGAFWLPLSVILITYFHIFRIARKRARKRAKSRSICSAINSTVFSDIAHSAVAKSRARGYSRSGSISPPITPTLSKPSIFSQRSSNERYSDQSTNFKSPQEQLQTITELTSRDGHNAENEYTSPAGNAEEKFMEGIKPFSLDTDGENMDCPDGQVRGLSHLSVPNDSVSNGECSKDMASYYDIDECQPKSGPNLPSNESHENLLQNSIGCKQSDGQELSRVGLANGVHFKLDKKLPQNRANRFKPQTRTVHKLLKKRRKPQPSQPRTLCRRYRNRLRNSARTLGMIIGGFVLCWMPFFILATIMPFCSECGASIPPTVFSICLWLGYSNSLLNPVIYAIWDKKFRNSFTKILKCRLKR